MGRRLAAVLTGALMLAGPLSAQDWITPESCAVPPEALAAAVLPETIRAQAEARAAGIENGVGRFWKVTDPSGAVSYLWGSYHSSDRLITDLPTPVWTALAGSKALYLETDPRAASRTEIEERQLGAGMWLAPEHMPYDKSYLEGSVRDWALARVAALTGDEQTFAALTDAGLAYLLLADPCEDFVQGVLPVQDTRLLLAAYEAGLAVRGLEGSDAFLIEMSQHDQKEVARAIVLSTAASLNPQDYSASRAISFRLYREGRIALMIAAGEIYLEGLFGAEKARDLDAKAKSYLIEDRNARFLHRMRRPLAEGGAFFVTGAYHIPGDKGLITLLRAAGYRVDRVALSGEAL